ncbi:hypothetical protein HDE_13320 [Halotydeus destructor]|nr:hypothetical protein HDE_13320 [Halotydeus destructor]
MGTCLFLNLVQEVNHEVSHMHHTMKLRDFHRSLFALTEFLLYFHISWKTQALKRLFACMRQLISSNESHHAYVFRYQQRLFLFSVVMYTYRILENFVYTFIEETPTLPALILNVTQAYAYLFIFVPWMLYYTSVKAIGDRIKLYFTTQTQRIRSVNQLELAWYDIQDLVKGVEDHLSLIPFIYLCLTFYETFSLVTLLAKRSMTLSTTVVILSYLASYAGHLVYAVYLIEKVNKSSKSHLSSFKRDVSLRRFPPEFTNIYDELRDSIELKLTAFSVVDLSYSTLLGTLSSLISLTVLYVQIDP